ncbi:MAG: hypothetical protein VW600_20425 [Ferrovibrio sp.]
MADGSKSAEKSYPARPVRQQLQPSPALAEAGLKGSVKPAKPEPDAVRDEIARIDRELKEQEKDFRKRNKPAADAGNPANAKLHVERKGVI